MWLTLDDFGEAAAVVVAAMPLIVVAANVSWPLAWSFPRLSNWNFDAEAVEAFDTPDAEPDDNDDEHDSDGDAIDDVADDLRTQLTCKFEFLSFSNEMRWICSSNGVLKDQKKKRRTQCNV